MGSNLDNFIAPDVCDGGVVTIDFGAEGTCSSDNCTSTFTVPASENQLQLIEVPDDVTVSCDIAIPPADVQASSQCSDDVEVTLETDFEDGLCPVLGVTIYTWTAVDECGNEVSASQRVTRVDDADPVLEGVPDDVTVDCDNIPDVPTVTAFDFCSEIGNPIFEETRTQGSCGYTITRTWTATDACNQTVTESQVITVEDNEAPVLPDAPDDLSVSCASDIPDAPDLTANDACQGLIQGVLSEQVIPGTCPNKFTLIRRWSFDDGCGNVADIQQTIEVNDDTPPVWTNLPDDLVVNCDDNISQLIQQWLDNGGNGTATDNCGNVSITNDYANQPLSCNNLTVDVVFSATDECGNETTASASIIFIDNTPPVLSGLVDKTVGCDEDAQFDVPDVSDNCDNDVDVDFEDFGTISDCEGGSILRVWTATDECGNTSTASQTITREADNTPPVISGVGSDQTIECDAILNFSSPSVNDDCDDNPSLNFEDEEGTLGCLGRSITRTWIATDDCGNTSTASQTVIFEDTTPPVIQNPPSDLVLECETPVNYEPIWLDNCDSDLILTAISSIAIDGCEIIETFKFTAEDQCGNSASVSFSVRFVDTTPPILSIDCPLEEITIECGIAIDPAIVTATDNCDGDVPVEFNSEVIPGNCPAESTIIWTWTATDDCGNVASCQQIIHVEDTTPPVLSIDCPLEDITIQCGIGIDPAIVTATDNCDGNVPVEFSSEVIPGNCPGGSTIIWTWTATDDCGNVASCQQIIHMEDITPPVLSIDCPLEEITIECGIVIDPAIVTATDNCDGDVPVEFSSEVVPGNCAAESTIIWTWTATDDCGNVASCQQIIHIEDSTSPVISGVGADGVYECGDNPQYSTPTAMDDCSNATITSSDDVTGSNCAGNIVTRTWVATDECGNTSSASQTLTPVDNEDPVITIQVSDASISCGDAIPTAPNVQTTDNCDDNVEVDLVETPGQDGCAGGVILTRVWTATDDCGNTATISQTITREADDEDPIITTQVSDASISCGDAIPTAPNVQAIDNCDDNVDVDLVETPGQDGCAGGVILTRVWTATDDCGNTATISQTITREADDEDPIITTQVSDASISCGDAIPTAPNVQAIDNCDDNVDVDLVETPGQDGCAGGVILTRVWTATDDCGNTDQVVQIIRRLEDDIAPTITSQPSDLSLDCSDNVVGIIQDWLDDNGGASATDDCNGAIFSNDYDGEIPTCEGDIVVRFTAIDECGNTASTSALIILVDDEDPVIQNAPENVTVECSAPAGQSLTALDECAGELTSDPVDERVDGNCPFRYVVNRTWTFTDGCGNTVSHTQVINVIDETAPEFVSVPADQDLNSLYDLQDPEDLEATDNCDGEVTISFNEERTQDGCGLRIERTWTAVDECDNSTSVTQIINVGLELDIDVKVLNHISCNGDSDGSAEVIGSDATGSATYKWDNGETGKIATALSAGTHRVTVTSSEGCEKILSVNITEPDALKVDVRKLADVNCGTGELGRAIAEPSGGTSPYSYAWSNGNDNQEADNLSAGVHTVTVTDANGCTAKGYVTISDEIRCNAALGDFVWEDLDRDGIQEAGEPGIPGVLVRLLTQSGEEIASAITDENGMYMFSDLAPGNYIIEFAVPDGFTPTLNDRGSDDTVDSDANKSTGRSPVITLAEGESNKTIDAGYYQNGSIGDFVWNDLDKDGIQDTGEPGKTNVRVILMDDVGNEIASTFTNANGEYLFNNIPPDKYFVKIEANANTVISPKDAGNDDNVDSDVNPNTGISDLIMLASGENIRNLDIGCYVDEVIDLELTKTVDNDRPEANEMVMFTIMVTNKGPSAATGVAVEDVVPNGYSDIISISNSGGATGNVITWSGITLETGESIALRFRVVALAFDESLDYKNVAQVTAADQTDSDSTPNNDDGDQSEDDEDSAKVIPGGEDLIDLELAKSVDDDHVEVGQIITYEVIVYNTSNTTATGIMVKDDIPSILSITEISDDGELTGRAIIWDFGTIEPGESKQVWYRAKVLEPIGTATSYKNVAQVINADQPDVDSAPNNDDGDQSEDDEDYVIITVKPQISELIDLALDKLAITLQTVPPISLHTVPVISLQTVPLSIMNNIVLALLKKQYQHGRKQKKHYGYQTSITTQTKRI